VLGLANTLDKTVPAATIAAPAERRTAPNIIQSPPIVARTSTSFVD
jgi:hypothetical protein